MSDEGHSAVDHGEGNALLLGRCSKPGSFLTEVTSRDSPIGISQGRPCSRAARNGNEGSSFFYGPNSVEKHNQQLALVACLCAMERLYAKGVLHWLKEKGIASGSGFVSARELSFFSSVNESSLRLEMKKIFKDIGIDDGPKMQGMLSFPPLQNVTLSRSTQVSRDIADIIEDACRSGERRHILEKETLSALVESHASLVMHKLKQAELSLRYLEQKHALLADRFTRVIRGLATQKRVTTTSLEQADHRILELEKQLESCKQTMESYRQENAELRRSLAQSRLRHVHWSIQAPLEAACKTLVQCVRDAVQKVKNQCHLVLSDVSFVETMRVTALKAEAQVKLLSSSLSLIMAAASSTASGAATGIMQSKPLNRELPCSQREYCERLHRLVTCEKENQTVPSSTTTPSLSGSKHSAGHEDGKSQKSVSHINIDVSDVLRSVSSYSQHLQNIQMLMENDCAEHKILSEAIIHSLQKCETEIERASREMRAIAQQAVNDTEEVRIS